MEALSKIQRWGVDSEIHSSRLADERAFPSRGGGTSERATMTAGDELCESWMSLRLRLVRRAATGRRIVLTTGNAELVSLLDQLRLGYRECALAEYSPQFGDIMVLSPERFESDRATSESLNTLHPTAQAIVCGSTRSFDWLERGDVFGERVVGMLPASVMDNVPVWRATLKALVRGPELGLDRFVARDASITRFLVARGRARAGILDDIRACIVQTGLPRRSATDLFAAVEGLVLRALADRSPNLDDADLPVGSEVRVALAQDDDNVVASVAELVTRPDPIALAGALRRGIQGGVMNPDDSGMELAVAARASNHVTVNVVPGIATETICVLPRKVFRAVRRNALLTTSVALYRLAVG